MDSFCFALFLFLKSAPFFPNLESYKLYVLVLHHPHTFMVMVMVHDHVSITQTDSCYNLTVATSKKKKRIYKILSSKVKTFSQKESNTGFRSGAIPRVLHLVQLQSRVEIEG